MSPKVSVIIPFRNARSELPATMNALQCQTSAPDTFEVIWIDDASDDESASWLEPRLPEGWRLLVHSQPRGAYAARNAGLRAASADHVAFTDADCRPREDWLQRGLMALASAPRVAGRIELELSSPPSTAEVVDAGRFFRQRRYVQEGFGATANLFVHRRVFDLVGEFDEQLKSGGDYEFGLRCSKAGIAIAYADDVVVMHPARSSIRELLAKGERVGFGTGQLVRRGGMPARRFVARAADRFALAGTRQRAERSVPAAGRSRSLLARGVHVLVLIATIVGGVRGFLLPRARATHD